VTLAASDFAAALERDGVPCEDLRGVSALVPEDEEQLLLVLERAARERQRLVPVGGGTKLGWCRPDALAAEGALALSTRRLAGIVAYEPGDGTLTALGGTRMGELEAATRAGGHRLTPDVPGAEVATLGGVLGAGLSGPDRLRFGPVRHHVLGMRVALADGTVAKSGGRLVKNVTGFDLHRLYCGSRGTLAVILEASLRLFALPERELGLTWTFDDARAALDAALELRARPLSPVSVTVENRGGPWRLHVFLAGRARQVEAERDAARGLGAPEAEVDGDEARAAARRARDLACVGGRWPDLRLATRPSAIGTELAPFIEGGGEVGVVIQPGIATAELFFEPGRATSRPASDVPHGAARWMERLRAAFDPDGIFASPSFPPRP